MSLDMSMALEDSMGLYSPSFSWLVEFPKDTVSSLPAHEPCGHANFVIGPGRFADLFLLLDGEHHFAPEDGRGNADAVCEVESSLHNDPLMACSLYVVNDGHGETGRHQGRGLGVSKIDEVIVVDETLALNLEDDVGHLSLTSSNLVSLVDQVGSMKARAG
mmetsp:Transcript_17084/g.49343  ORF Transcript_17084/g.49343 Transcript_17084/m.49343 type:complete len:161 (-) Transcript_17084:450-932(-)